MLNAIIGLFTSFNPVIVGLMLSAGAYFALRHRMMPSLRGMVQRSRQALRAFPPYAAISAGAS